MRGSIFVLFLIFGCVAQGQDTEILVAALAKIGNEVITSRDLQINQFLNEVENPFKEYSEKPMPLKELIWEQLVFMESKKVFSTRVSDADINEFVQEFKTKSKSDELWKSLGVSDKELRQSVRRKLGAKKLLRLKMPKQLIYISDTEINNYYKQHKNQLGQKPLEEVRERIRNGLQILKARTRFYDWVATMSRSHLISYYSGFKIK